MAPTHLLSRWRRAGPEALALLLVVGFVAAFAVVPAAYLFARSVADGGGAPVLARVLADPANRAAVGQSLLQGALSALCAVFLGYPLGFLLGRYRFRGRDAIRSLLLVPFLLPTLVVVIGWLELFGPGGLLVGPFAPARALGSGIPALVAINVLFNAPVVALFTVAGAESVAPGFEESVATLGGGPGTVYRDVWARPTWTGAAVGGLLTFVFSALSFAPPLLLCGNRCATVELRVWELAAGTNPDPAAAGVLSLLLVVGFLVPAAAYLLLARRLVPATGAGTRALRPVPWRSPAVWPLLAAAAALLVAEVGLLSTVLLRSVLPSGGGAVARGWSLLFSDSVQSRLGLSVGSLLVNSVVFAALASALALVLAVATAFVGLGHRVRSLAVGLAAFVPVLLSPIVLALALGRLWGPLFGGPDNVWLLIVLSQALLGLPFALQSLELPLRALPARVREATQTLGATAWGSFVDAELPRVADGLERATLFALALGLGEFTATFFLVTPSFTTLPVAIYALEGRGLLPAAGAGAALLLLMSLAIYATIVAGARRVRR